MRTVLIVDDEPSNLQVLTQLLRPSYRVRAANSGKNALASVEAEVPDLIVLDVMMPDIDGYEVLRRLRENKVTHDIPVIFLTALSEPNDEEKGLELGAADYITKPIKPIVVLARIKAQLEAKEAREFLRDQNSLLEAEVSRRMAENDLTQVVTIRALAHLAETRDPETGHHILRTQSYVEVLALHLQEHPRFTSQLSRNTINLLVRSAPLHDIGKVGIPDSILLKPGPLTAEEWVVMKTHARLGAEAIEQAERDAQQAVPFLAQAKEIARWHHEKWDGTGYPDGLAGDAIPVSARLMAIADVFDALIFPRVYKPAIPIDEARNLIVSQRGRHFDPDVVDAFLECLEKFIAIAHRYGDGT